MPVSDTNNTQIGHLKGVHLFHFGLSSCSQRVRLALEEKHVDWISHIIDLQAMENTSLEYQQIHPKGYVPAMIHDGRLITESTDIISYIDQSFSGPSLLPEDPETIKLVSSWLDIINHNQIYLKTLTYELLFKKLGHFSKKEDIDYYLSHQNNQQLVQFVSDFVTGFSKERIGKATNEANDLLKILEETLSTKPYIAGAYFSLADIAAVVNVHRFILIDWDISSYGSVKRWYEKITNRESFHRAITAYP